MDGQYIGHKGVLFKRNAEGGYLQAVFCPICKRAMSSMADMLHFYCPYCNRRAEFTGKQRPTIMATLPETEKNAT
ncbi:MAG: hypothetical protein QGH94_17420, partial [Phycisphaerae bacterium]|nr:hypothetical protein [Phycisphaerae bacterium]MDP7289766.1 hypothetical protein [Phycisphaerae bacterium]